MPLLPSKGVEQWQIGHSPYHTINFAQNSLALDGCKSSKATPQLPKPIHNNQQCIRNVWRRGIVAVDHFDDLKVKFYMNNLIAKLDERGRRYWLSLQKKYNNQPMHSNSLRGYMAMQGCTRFWIQGSMGLAK